MWPGCPDPSSAGKVDPCDECKFGVFCWGYPVRKMEFISQWLPWLAVSCVHLSSLLLTFTTFNDDALADCNVLTDASHRSTTLGLHSSSASYNWSQWTLKMTSLSIMESSSTSNARTRALYTYDALIIVLFTCNEQVFKTDFILQFEVGMISKLHNYNPYESVYKHIIEVTTYRPTVG